MAGGDDVVARRGLLQHAPHDFDVVPGMAPIAPCVEVAEEEAILQPDLDAAERAGDLAGDEGLAAAGRLVVEEDAIGGVDAVGLAIVHGDPVGVELGDGVGRARIEGRGLGLRAVLDEAVHL